MRNSGLDFFKTAYAIAMVFLMVLIISIPSLIKADFYFLKEEFFEGIIIAFLLCTGMILNLLYEWEIRKWQKHLEEAWRHIGKTNLLVDRFKSALFEIKKYPETKKDIKYVFGVMAEKIFGIVDSSCVMFRIMETKKLKTLSEYFQARGTESAKNIKIGNGELIRGESDDFTIIASQAENIKIKTFCIFPLAELNKEQKMFINKIVDDFTMLYVIFGFYALQK